MTDRYPVAPHIAADARFDAAGYERAYTQSTADPERFWGEVGRRLDWIQPYSRVKNVSFKPDDFRIRWYEDGILNVSFNCLDRHLPEFGAKTAIHWQGDSPGESRRISYFELFAEVNRFANALKTLGVRRGDCVTIYLPMIPEAAVAMLACARIGAIHSIVFGGFSPESLADRLRDCQSKVIVTADEGLRGGKRVALKANVDAALKLAPGIAGVVIVVPRTGAPVAWNPDMDVRYDDLLAKAPAYCVPEPMGAEDPLFILYTSGSTGKPKGVLHTSAGYLVYAAYTFESIFDIKPDDVFWCTADVGWITGHSYVVYGPLACAATTVMFEGVPTYPNPGRCWEICDELDVTVFYTAPTAIRTLMREGDAWVTQHARQSLRLLGSVGEPINSEAWGWYHQVVGEGRCPIVDTWWQTETGGILIAPLPGATELKPGAATRPFFGIQPAIVDANGTELHGACEGNLILKDSWPGQMRSVYRDHQRFIETYFKTYPGSYFTGDGARRDEDGDFWITGRVDDVINVSGHRLGTAEIESAIASHADVAEAAVVGFPHDIKGQGIYAFVILKKHREHSSALLAELQQFVRRHIGPIAVPDVIQWAPGLPKTRSGKIMRRVLRKIAADEADQLGDISSLADAGVVTDLIETRGRLRSTARA